MICRFSPTAVSHHQLPLSNGGVGTVFVNRNTACDDAQVKLVVLQRMLSKLAYDV